MSIGSRRRFLQGTIATAAALALPRPVAMAASTSGEKTPDNVAEGFLTDVNVYISHWPIRRMPADEPGTLTTRLQRSGVKSAWTGSLDGLLHKDVGAVNVRLR